VTYRGGGEGEGRERGVFKGQHVTVRYVALRSRSRPESVNGYIMPLSSVCKLPFDAYTLPSPRQDVSMNELPIHFDGHVESRVPRERTREGREKIPI